MQTRSSVSHRQWYVGFALFFFVVIVSSDATATVVVVPEGIDTQCGRGYSTLQHKFTGTSAVGTCTPVTTTGQTTSFSLHRVETTEELSESLGVSASASFVSTSGQFSAKFRRLQETVVSDTGLVIALEERIINTPNATLPGRTLKPEALTVLKKSGRAEFVKRYGDEFVVTQTFGGRFVAFLEMHTHSMRYRDDVAGQISGDLGTFSASASLQSRIERISKRAETTYVLFRAGTLDTVPEQTDLVRAAMNFPTGVAGKSVPISVETIPAYQADNWPTGIEGVDFSHANQDLNTLAVWRDRLLKIRDSLRFKLSRPTAFSQKALNTVVKANALVEQNLRNISKSASQILDHPFAEHTIPNIDVEQIESSVLPPDRPLELTARLVSVDQFGGSHRVDVGGDEGAWLGSAGGSDAGLQSFSAELVPHVEGLHLLYEAHAWTHDCPNCQLSMLSGSGQDGRTVFPPATGFPEHRLTGVRIWLDGPLAKKYAVHYRVCSGGIGAAEQHHDGEWAEIATTNDFHSACGVQVWFEFLP